ncbi:sulfite exporter TauE/SafE family protein [Streptomyces sp. NPDC020681]|uniref:urease accessory protein UreH domain-containing protein n=1 Tax=Streptomyces sp. NPDC020681 TaxID=3365083 RepID=UPI0037885FEF
MRKRIALVGALVVGLFLVLTGTAAAHPLGNFTVNHYDGLVVGRGELRVDHVEDLAEIPTAQVDPASRTPEALPSWARARCATAAREGRVEVNGRAVALRPGASRAEVRPGQAGLPTLRLECRLTATLPDGEAAIGFRAPGGEGPGWREITARGDRMQLTSSDAPQKSESRRLTGYPEDRLSSPPSRTEATLTAVPGGPALVDDGGTDRDGAGAASVLPRGADRWTQALTGLVERRELTLPFAALALATAIALGALHALAPGHGKTLMAAAAAAGGRNSVRDVLTLGASVTVTHTLGVFALGALVAAGSAAAPSVVAWLGVASGALVAVAGAALVRRAWRRRGHQHTHDHHHHHHTHSHTHADHDHQTGHDHTHHHHERRGMRGTLLLGFAGGLVPSPSAVVVLVGAAALGQAWFGFLLVLAYGAGLALTLAAAGFLVVRVGERAAAFLMAFTERKPRSGRLAAGLRRAMPLGTAFMVFAVGCGLVLRGAAAAWS